MRFRTHCRFLLLFTLAWAAFWVLGLPAYYQQYSRTVMLWFDGLLLIPIVSVFVVVLRRVPRSRRMSFSLWLAFYFSVPLAFYDWLYCGLYLGHGIRFVLRYWYLTVYYLLPWLFLPAVSAVLNRRDTPDAASAPG